MASSSSSSNSKVTENYNPEGPPRSMASLNFIKQLVGAYEIRNEETIQAAQMAVVGALLTEKRIEKKKVEDKKDAKFAEELGGLSLGEKEGATKKD